MEETDLRFMGEKEQESKECGVGPIRTVDQQVFAPRFGRFNSLLLLASSLSEFYHAPRILPTSELRRQLGLASNSFCIWPLPSMFSSPLGKLNEIVGKLLAGLVKV